MKYLSLTILTSLIALVGGCGATINGDTYCDVASPIYFNGPEGIDMLMRNDKELLVDVMVHNETHERICGG